MKSLAAHIKQASLAVIALSALGVMNQVQAAGTAAGTDIANSATVNYQVGGVSQTAINSNTTTFKVDRKVDLTVTAGSATTTSPGTTGAAVLYTVTNTGNGSDSFTLTATNQTGDNFDVSNIKIYQDNGTTPGVFDAGDTQVSAAVAFTADQSIKFFIVSDMPLTATNGQNAVVKLTATTTSTATTGADTTGVDVVFADTGNDGTENANNQYSISTATLAVVKSSTIISDPVNNTTNPKAIPGAVIEYTITVTNSGAAAASSVVLSDNMPTNTTYVAGSMQLNSTSLTDASDADAGTYTSTGTPKITINAGTIAASGGTATAKFRVTIN
jgi:uncharacterized repeat protein (TIGR01451 family)